MAEKASKPSNTKRRVKSPETFRERALKTGESANSTSKSAGIFKAIGRGIKLVVSPIGWLLKKIFNRKPFRVVGRILVPSYFRKSWQELKLVKWPSWPESRRLTFAVLVFAIIFGVSVAAVDYVLDNLFQNILIN